MHLWKPNSDKFGQVDRWMDGRRDGQLEFCADTPLKKSKAPKYHGSLVY